MPLIMILLLLVGLFLICWPLALLVLILLPVLWLISIPLRMVGIMVNALLALFSAVMFLPARLLGHKG